MAARIGFVICLFNAYSLLLVNVAHFMHSSVAGALIDIVTSSTTLFQ